MMNKNPIPSAPISPLVLPEPAPIVAVAQPFIHYDYMIYKRKGWCCYIESFLLTKQRLEKWKITLFDPDKSSYDIPVNKTNEDISMIINSLGVKKKGIYKVNVFNRNHFIQTKHFISLSTIIEFITKNERIISGVVYSS